MQRAPGQAVHQLPAACMAIVRHASSRPTTRARQSQLRCAGGLGPASAQAPLRQSISSAQKPPSSSDLAGAAPVLEGAHVANMHPQIERGVIYSSGCWRLACVSSTLRRSLPRSILPRPVIGGDDEMPRALQASHPWPSGPRSAGARCRRDDRMRSDHAHAEPGHAQQHAPLGACSRRPGTARGWRAPRSSSGSSARSSCPVGMDCDSSRRREAVVPQQPVRLIQPMLAHQRRRAIRQARR